MQPCWARCLLIAASIALAPVAVADTGVIGSWCDQLGSRLHSVSADACRVQDFTVATERTTRGNLLVMRDIAVDDDKLPPDAKRILVIGGIHGDELTSVSTVFRWLSWIDQSGAVDYRWRVIPVANPDGLFARPPTRVNANGVDINRNFQTPDWEHDARSYWTQRTGSDPRRNPGKQACSEVETRWLQQQVETFHPDLVISVHAPYNLLDYDGSMPEPTRFGRLLLNRLGVYPGSMGNYSGLYKQIPVITIELPNATIMPSLSDQRAMWEDMLQWMRRNLPVALPPSGLKGIDVSPVPD